VASLIVSAMPKSAASKFKKVRVLSSRVVFRGPVFQVTHDEVIEPSGIRAKRDIVRHPGSVVVLAIDESRSHPRVLLERQYRYAADAFLWELPAGRIDAGESELAAAKRELLEETGYTATRWQRIVRYYASPGFVNETMAIYVARDLRRGKAQPEEDEAIRTRLFPLSSVVHMAKSGKIRDGKTLIGILWINKSLSSVGRDQN
jgi:ADP-ribose pyrophosphatase